MAKSRAATAVRGIAAVFYMIASIIIFTSRQKLEEYSFFFVSHRTLSDLLFLALVNIIICIYNILLLPIPSDSLLWRSIVLFDMILCCLKATSLGVGWHLYSQLVEGNINSIYTICMSPVCVSSPNFCAKILWSLICSTAGFVLHFLLLSFSILLTTGLLDSFLP